MVLWHSNQAVWADLQLLCWLSTASAAAAKCCFPCLYVAPVLDRPDSEYEYDSDEETSVAQPAGAAAAAPLPTATAVPAVPSSSGSKFSSTTTNSSNSKSANGSGKLSKAMDSLRDNPVLLAGTAAATGGLLVLLSALSKRGGDKQNAAGKGKATGPGMYCCQPHMCTALM